MENNFENAIWPFGIQCNAIWLTNALGIFQHMMNNVFQEFLDIFMIIYVDDILMFSKNEKECKECICLILQKLCEMGLYAKLEKYTFH